jgi:hypothetical protein
LYSFPGLIRSGIAPFRLEVVDHAEKYVHRFSGSRFNNETPAGQVLDPLPEITPQPDLDVFFSDRKGSNRQWNNKQQGGQHKSMPPDEK